MLFERSICKHNGLPVIDSVMAHTLERAVSPLRENVSIGAFSIPLGSFRKAAASQASWANHLNKPHKTAVFLWCCATSSILLLGPAFLVF